MTSTEKLAVINSMRIVDADISNGELVYAIVDYTEENIQKLATVVPDVDEYIRTVGDPDGTKESIDISTAAFFNAGADCYVKGKFRNDSIDYAKLDAIEKVENELKLKIKEIDKRIALRSGPNYHDETKKIDSLHGEALAYEKVLEMLDKYKAI